MPVTIHLTQKYFINREKVLCLQDTATSSRPEVFLKSVLKNFNKIHRKTPELESLLNRALKSIGEQLLQHNISKFIS